MEDIAQNARIKASNKASDEFVDNTIRRLRMANNPAYEIDLADKVLRPYLHALNRMQEEHDDVGGVNTVIAVMVTNFIMMFVQRLFLPADGQPALAFVGGMLRSINYMVGEDALAIWGAADRTRQ